MRILVLVAWKEHCSFFLDSYIDQSGQYFLKKAISVVIYQHSGSKKQNTAPRFELSSTQPTYVCSHLSATSTGR